MDAPALPERVVPACVETPAHGERAKHPAVARTLDVVRARGVISTSVATLLGARRAMVDSKHHCVPPSVRVSLLVAHGTGRHSGAVCKAIPDGFWPLALAIPAAVGSAVRSARTHPPPLLSPPLHLREKHGRGAEQSKRRHAQGKATLR